MLSRSDQVIINMLYYVIHEIFFQSTKEWVAATNISNTTRFRCIVVVVVVAPIIYIPNVFIIIIADAYRYVKLVVPKCITRNTNIQSNRMNIVVVK